MTSPLLGLYICTPKRQQAGAVLGCLLITAGFGLLFLLGCAGSGPLVRAVLPCVLAIAGLGYASSVLCVTALVPWYVRDRSMESTALGYMYVCVAIIMGASNLLVGLLRDAFGSYLPVAFFLAGLIAVGTMCSAKLWLDPPEQDTETFDDGAHNPQIPHLGLASMVALVQVDADIAAARDYERYEDIHRDFVRQSNTEGIKGTRE